MRLHLGILLALLSWGCTASRSGELPWAEQRRAVTSKKIGDRPAATKAYAYVWEGNRIQSVDRAEIRKANGFVMPDSTVIAALTNDSKWRPGRHFGPFISGSDFEQIRIAIPSSQDVNTWYFNGFSQSLGTVERPFHDLYWNNNIPANSSSSIDLLSTILLSLKRIEYSSRYGGAVCLVFGFAEQGGYQGPWAPGSASLPADQVMHSEDFGFDIRTATYAFDLGGLEAKLFLSLAKDNFNPTMTFFPSGGVMAELIPDSVTAYKGNSFLTSSSPEFPSATAELDARMKSIATNLAAATSRTNALRIAYSFIHDQFNTEFNQAGSGVPRKVASLYISDGFIDLTTRPGLPYFTVQFQGSASGACFTCDGLGSVPDLRLALRVTQTFANGSDYQVSFVDNFDDDDADEVGRVSADGRWHTGAVVYMSDCDRVTSIDGRLRVVDRDSLLTGGDDLIATLELGIQPVCSELQQDVQASRWGVVAEDSTYSPDLVSGQTLSAGLRSRTRLDVR